MNKKILKYIEKELKKENSLIISYEPTLAELDYLKERNIVVNPVTVMRQGFLIDWSYLVQEFEYSIEF